ncbi:MAG: hypothetical protein JWN03_2294 [Nocardia sp.]|uniref:TY-Chap domain-containing protein n=1 Tax=Nocardia sp. TaxID=1821 RepID=UPI002613232A|nr:hypothetical protein [Nocardia sp.]MCU1642019.1 hypothetical protein [Nocardia sp.]
MADDDWAGLAKDITWVLYPDWDNDERMISPKDGDSVQLRDTLTGQRVLFWAEDKGITIRVTVPDDPTDADRLRSVLDSQRTTSFSMVRDYESGRMVPNDQPLWRPVELRGGREETAKGSGQRIEEYAREWWTGWRHNAGYRDEVATAIIAVLRDGLRTTPAHLRVSAYSNYGPDRAPRVGDVAPDRPASRGLSPHCSDWDEFASRLEWVLTTLPNLGYLNLSIPGRSLSMQLSKELDDAIRGLCSTGADASAREPQDRMSDLGWRWGTPYGLEGMVEFEQWTTPPAGTGTVAPTLDRLVALVVTTLRTVGGAERPSDLAFEAFSNLAGVDDMSYVSADLGVPHA